MSAAMKRSEMAIRFVFVNRACGSIFFENYLRCAALRVATISPRVGKKFVANFNGLNDLNASTVSTLQPSPPTVCSLAQAQSTRSRGGS